MIIQIILGVVLGYTLQRLYVAHGKIKQLKAQNVILYRQLDNLVIAKPCNDWEYVIDLEEERSSDG